MAEGEKFEVEISLQGRTMNRESKELRKLYWEKEFSLRQIAKLRGKACSTVLNKMRKYAIKRRSWVEAMKLAGIMKEPKLNPSPALAYVLGVLRGDGGVYANPANKSFVVILEVADKEFAENFRSALHELGFNPNMWQVNILYFRTSTPSGKKGWRVEAQSKIFYDWYNSMFLADLKKAIEGHEISFLRGFYESEGVHHGRKIAVFNKNFELLTMVKHVLSELGFPSTIGKPDKRTGVYALCLSSGKRGWKQGDATRRASKFIALINPCIKR